MAVLFHVDFSNKLVYIPLAFLIWMMGGLFTTFGIAASYGQISTPPEWPSISSTGAYPPTSCIFSMVLTWGSVVGFFTILYYYQYIRVGFRHQVNQGLNSTMLVLGILVCFGTAIVGCNQRPNIAILHAIGAFMAFIIGAVYCGMVTYQTYCIKRHFENAYPNWFLGLRATLVIFEAISFLLMMIFSAKRADSRTYATLGNTFEWCVVGFQCLFYATFMVEFSNLDSPDLVIDLTRPAARAIKAETIGDHPLGFEEAMENRVSYQLN